MREKIAQQQPLVLARIDHSHANELREMSRVLDENPEIVDLVFQDLVRSGVRDDIGRCGLSADTVLRALLVKQMNGFSYEQLAFHLADSSSYQTFCRIGIGQKPPSKSTLQRDIKKLRAETLHATNRALVQYAKKQGVEDGQRVRTDCTEVEANVRIPTDSSLLLDCVRVLVRLLKRAEKHVAFHWRNHCRVAKRRDVAINNARSNNDRQPLYGDLIKHVRRTLNYADSALRALRSPSGGGTPRQVITRLTDEFADIFDLTERVIWQTEQRVFEGRTVEATKKVVSIFETHTAIISKARRDTVYGHKILLTTGTSGLVVDSLVERHNPKDSKLAVGAIERLIDVYGEPPSQACFDGGFSSKQNLHDIKALGVEDVAFSKGPGLEVSQMVRSSWVYRCLKKFRAGIEGTISFLKRCFGLRRCTWRSFDSFRAYVAASVLAANVLVIARAALKA